MKLNPPKIVIPPNDPYKNDVFGNRKQFGDSLIKLIKEVEDSIVICLDAQWGDGKTTFLKMWEADLERQGYTYIHYDAFLHDHNEDPFVSFVNAILCHNQCQEADRKAFVKSAKEVGKNLGVIGFKLITALATRGQISGDELLGLFNEASERMFTEECSKYKTHEKELEAFKENIKSICKSIVCDTQFSMVFVIDELDRCRPNFALKVLERIKHYFDVDNITFVIATNTKQLETIIKANYGSDIDAKNYLQKFFSIQFEMPRLKKQRGYEHDDYEKYIEHLCQIYDIGFINDEYPFNLLSEYSRHLNLSYRQLENIHKKLYMYYLGRNNSFTDPMIVVMLAVLEVINKEILVNLKNSTITYDNLKLVLGFDEILKTSSNIAVFEYLDENLMFYLLDDDELKTRRKEGVKQSCKSLLNGYHFNRLQAIQYICDHYMSVRV